MSFALVLSLGAFYSSSSLSPAMVAGEKNFITRQRTMIRFIWDPHNPTDQRQKIMNLVAVDRQADVVSNNYRVRLKTETT
jgi:hypothetical protein